MKNSPFEERPWWKAEWPYWVGGVLLALLNTGVLYVNAHPWGITTPIALWGGGVFSFLGGSPWDWGFFREMMSAPGWQVTYLYGGTLLNLGAVTGALFSSFLSSEFRIRKIRPRKMVLAALIGGFLMGYGARIALGCNIGALLGGISSFSLHGWVYLVFLPVGAFIGTKLLLRFFL